MAKTYGVPLVTKQLLYLLPLSLSFVIGVYSGRGKNMVLLYGERERERIAGSMTV